MTKQQLAVLYVISVAAVVACFANERIPQDLAYHVFADRRTLWSITNFWNVVSNLPFVVIGIFGLTKVGAILHPLKANFVWFFIGIVLTGFGSAYYHQFPKNATLVWDRLPMTIAFMSFFSIVVGEFIGENAGRKLLYPLLGAGLFSISFWVCTDDLRFYALVQFLPILLILIILFLSRKEKQHKKYFWMVVVCYTVAKFLESYDVLIFDVTQHTIGGHALKHIAAAFAPYFFYKFTGRKFNLKK